MTKMRLIDVKMDFEKSECKQEGGFLKCLYGLNVKQRTR